MGAYFVGNARNFAPEAERKSWSAKQALEMFESRLTLVTGQLARSPYLAGEAFTAADISVTYALELLADSVAYPSARPSEPTWHVSAGAKLTVGPWTVARAEGLGSAPFCKLRRRRQLVADAVEKSRLILAGWSRSRSVGLPLRPGWVWAGRGAWRACAGSGRWRRGGTRLGRRSGLGGAADRARRCA